MLPGILASCEKPPERVHRRCGNLRNSFEDRWFNTFCSSCSPHKPMQKGSGIPPSYESSPSHSCSPLSTGGLPSCTSGAMQQRRCCNGWRMRLQPLIQTGCMLPATHGTAAILAYVIFNRSCGRQPRHRNCLKTTQHHQPPSLCFLFPCPLGVRLRSGVRATSSSSVAAVCWSWAGSAACCLSCCCCLLH